MSILPFPSPLRQSQVRRKITVHYETPLGKDREAILHIHCLPGESEAVLLGRAANVFRRVYGYDDRLVSIDLNPGQ